MLIAPIRAFLILLERVIHVQQRQMVACGNDPQSELIEVYVCIWLQ